MSDTDYSMDKWNSRGKQSPPLVEGLNRKRLKYKICHQATLEIGQSVHTLYDYRPNLDSQCSNIALSFLGLNVPKDSVSEAHSFQRNVGE